MSERTALTLIAVGALLSGGLAFVGAPVPPPPVPTVAHLSGMWAGYGVAVMLLLMARVPAVERGVGADRLARWHATGGRTILVLILVHAVAATLGWMQVQGVGPLTATAQVLGFPGLLAATVATLLFCLVGAVSIRAARRRLSYETWHAVHLGTYVAVGLSFAHELAGPDLAGRPAVQLWWSLLYTSAFALVVRYRLLDPVLRGWRHGMRVDRLIDEGHGVTTVLVRGRHLDDLRAEPGQFFRWRFLTASTWRSANPFSLSAPPSDRFLRLTVKQVGDGTRAIARIPVGTRVLAEGPYGAMTERRRIGDGVLLLAAGVGITPMRALFETVDAPGGRLTLVYRAASPAEVLFREELERIAAARGARLVLLTGRSSDPANALTAENLRAWAPDVADRDVFICASPRFSAAARDALDRAGVPRSRIHEEEFAF